MGDAVPPNLGKRDKRGCTPAQPPASDRREWLLLLLGVPACLLFAGLLSLPITDAGRISCRVVADLPPLSTGAILVTGAYLGLSGLRELLPAAARSVRQHIRRARPAQPDDAQDPLRGQARTPRAAGPAVADEEPEPQPLLPWMSTPALILACVLLGAYVGVHVVCLIAGQAGACAGCSGH